MAGPAYYQASVNIALNEDWVVPFIYQSVDPVTSALTPIDLTGSLLKCEIRTLEADKEAIVSVYSPDHGIEITDMVNGAFTIVLARTQTWRLPPGIFFIDCVRLMPNGWQERLWEGAATVVQGTTR